MASLGASWVVKRLTKVFLKRHLSHLLATEVDVQQLEIQLDNGCFEIRDCLLDSEYLNSRLTEYPVSVQSALVEKVKVSLFPLTVECSGVAIVLAERELDMREIESGNDLSGENINKISNSILDDGLGLMEDIMQGLFSKLSIRGKDILICVTLLTGHELYLATKQLSLVSDAKDLVRKIELDGLSFKISGNQGVEHFRTNSIQVCVLLSQESYSQKEQEPKRTILSFSIQQNINLYATEAAISLLQHLFSVIEKWKSFVHLSGEIPEDFSLSLQKVLGLPESINSNSVDIWRTLEDRAVAGTLDESEEDENAINALDNIMSAIFFSTESILQGTQDDGQNSVYCLKGQIPGCALRLCNFTEHFSGDGLYFSLEDIDLLCTFKGPCECDVSFASFQICNQLDRKLKGEEDQTCIFDEWLMPEDPIVFSIAKYESAIAETVKKLENLENEQTDQPGIEQQANSNSLQFVPILSCRHQGYRQRVSAVFFDSVQITLTLDLMTIWLDNLMALSIIPFTQREKSERDHDQKHDFELTLAFRKILLGGCSQHGDQRLRCVLVLQTEQGRTDHDIASEGFHALVTSDSVSISAEVELMQLSIGTSKSDNDFLRFQGLKLQYLMSDETTIAIKSKNDVLTGQMSARNYNYIKSVVEHFQQHIPKFSSPNSKGNMPYSLTLDAVDIQCELNADFGYLKGSVHLVDLIFRSDEPTISCEEASLDILEAAIWQRDSKTSLPAQPLTTCFCKIKSLAVLFHGTNDTVFRVTAEGINIGRQGELLGISTISFEHTYPNAGIVAMLNGLRVIHQEYLKVYVSNTYLLLSNFKVKCLQGTLESMRNIFVDRQVERQPNFPSAISCEMLGSTEAVANVDTVLYDCNVLNSKLSGLAHEGVWYDKGIASESSDRGFDSVRMDSRYQSDYVGTKILDAVPRKRSLEVFVDKFEVLYENDPAEPDESHGSLRLNCNLVKYVISTCDFEGMQVSRVSACSVSAYFSYESASDHVREDLVLEMPRKSMLRSENAFCVDLEGHQGKISLSIDAAGFRFCIRYCFLQWFCEICKGLSIGDWEDIGGESDFSFDLRFRGAACSFSYVPSNAKLLSIKSKSREDLLRLVPKLQAELWLCEANLVDAIDLQAGGRMLVSMWLNDITKVQLNRFLLDLPGYTAIRQLKERTNWNLDDSSLEHVALRCLFSLARYLETEQKTL